MDRKITIGYPVLITGEKFEVKHRKLPNGSWDDDGDQTNAPFIITGLDPNSEYELSIIYIMADGTECPEVIYPFDTPPDDVVRCRCLSVDEVFISGGCDDNPWLLTINHDGGVNACGARVDYSVNGGAETIVQYEELPSPLVIPVSSPDYVNVTLYLRCCSTYEWITCFKSPIIDIRECGCINPLVLSQYGINANPDDYTGAFIYFTLTPSSPAMYPVTVIATQLNATGTTDYVSVQVNAQGYHEIPINPQAFDGVLQYSLVAYNECGADMVTASVLGCGSSIQFMGEESFPAEFYINITGSDNISILFNASQVPVKFELEYDGNIIADTGYRGSTAYQAWLSQWLLDHSLPDETIQGNGLGTINFNNDQGLDYAILRVYSPRPGNVWTVDVKCGSGCEFSAVINSAEVIYNSGTDTYSVDVDVTIDGSDSSTYNMEIKQLQTNSASGTITVPLSGSDMYQTPVTVIPHYGKEILFMIRIFNDCNEIIEVATEPE